MDTRLLSLAGGAFAIGTGSLIVTGILPHLASGLAVSIDTAGLLISIEPLIDMGRTALNVSGSITAGTLTSRVLGETDMAVFNADAELSVDSEGDTSRAA